MKWWCSILKLSAACAMAAFDGWVIEALTPAVTPKWLAISVVLGIVLQFLSFSVLVISSRSSVIEH